MPDKPNQNTLMKKLVCISLLLIVCMINPLSTWAQKARHDGRGLTFSLAYGFMHQQDQVFGDSHKGHVINAGVGVYLHKDLVLFLRGITSEVIYLRGARADIEYRQIAGFLGTSLQYWFNKRIYAEGGAGIGSMRHGDIASPTVRLPSTREVGFSILIGAGINVLDKGKGLINLGLEDTFIVLDNKYIHNIGVIVRYQLR